MSEADLLNQELQCERKLRMDAEKLLQTALMARAKAERERDIYKVSM